MTYEHHHYKAACAPVSRNRSTGPARQAQQKETMLKTTWHSLAENTSPYNCTHRRKAELAILWESLLISTPLQLLIPQESTSRTRQMLELRIATSKLLGRGGTAHCWLWCFFSLPLLYPSIVSLLHAGQFLHHTNSSEQSGGAPTCLVAEMCLNHQQHSCANFPELCLWSC